MGLGHHSVADVTELYNGTSWTAVNTLKLQEDLWQALELNTAALSFGGYNGNPPAEQQNLGMELTGLKLII